MEPEETTLLLGDDGQRSESRGPGILKQPRVTAASSLRLLMGDVAGLRQASEQQRSKASELALETDLVRRLDVFLMVFGCVSQGMLLGLLIGVDDTDIEDSDQVWASFDVCGFELTV